MMMVRMMAMSVLAMFARMAGMASRSGCMMTGLLVIAFLMMRGGLAVMTGSMVMMLCRDAMVLCALMLYHRYSPA
ncbi:hypothetical protein [Sphingomonas morindae]|uniref:Secreted protein n=1 Tax=Sphingomonas morindae TaxID=1541170 RepID=A0ABY4XEK8_9SPHN|nr:hypothetical protein [Sphingomonas morindae]USI75243.1 hypothetical protein LHA26_19895 [Sphingomonas morindae]